MGQEEEEMQQMHSDMQFYRAIADGVVRNGDLVARAPSPPYVHVPTVTSASDPSNKIKPCFNRYNPGGLSVADIDIITGGRTQVTNCQRLKDQWLYEDRRTAQRILDFLYLGPMAVVRDHDLLRLNGITMLLVVRDISMVGMRSLSLEKAVAELGVELKYVDLGTRQELIRSFPTAVDLINEHMLRLNTVPVANMDPAAPLGKVMVVCDTGNDRSAAIVAAYLMAMYGLDVVGACQFVSSQRFCVNFNETVKQLLLSYEDLLQASRMTALAIQQGAAPDQQTKTLSEPVASKKRRVEETMDNDGDLDMDRARYEDRTTFAPFVQGNLGS